MAKWNGKPMYCIIREPVARYDNRVICKIKPECKDCPYPKHGFICYSKDGSCLKTDMDRLIKGGNANEKYD